MSAISWNEASPIPSSNASSGDDEFRSFMTNVAIGLATSFDWPGSGSGSTTSAGQSQLGNLRFAEAGSSAVTGGYPDGFLLLNSDHISLHHIGSTSTGILAHSGMLDMAGGLGTAPFTTHYLLQQGSSVTTGSVLSQSGATFAITFPQVFTAAPPFVFVGSTSNVFAGLKVGSITSVGFTSYVSYNNTSLSIVTLDWRTEGTVLL